MDSLAIDRKIIENFLEPARSVSSKLGKPISESRGEFLVTPIVLQAMTSKTQDYREEYLKMSIASRSLGFLYVSHGGRVVCRARDVKSIQHLDNSIIVITINEFCSELCTLMRVPPSNKGTQLHPTIGPRKARTSIFSCQKASFHPTSGTSLDFRLDNSEIRTCYYDTVETSS